MSVMDFFRGNSGSAAPAPAAEPTNNATFQEGGTGQRQEPTIGGEGTSTGEATGEVSGLDAFKDLWDNKTEGEEGKEGADPQDPSAFLNIDPKAIQDAVSKVDFAQVLDAETLGQISEGGEAAQQAFSKSMNSIAQHVFSQSMIANATLVKQALAQSTGAFDSRAQEVLRKSQIDQTVSGSNPAFNHPSAKPIVESMQAQLAKKYPQASPQEISDKANQWFQEFANEVGAPQRKQAASNKAKGEPDWEAFFGENEA